ncbi:MAG: inorganic pyrophosphatase [Acidobacteria bacterium]|nr:MAG: inorganic pyrophosphatase [Acidobacteriota bacterium]PYV70915.1 MAG: inorganic pyrophosphatase [Acidobacteriota bacterium]
MVQVVIETPKGSRNKYKFEPNLSSFKLSKVLPDGMVFPYDFGFVPSTQAADGDPIDVLLLIDEPAFPGCVIESRLIGVIEGEQAEEGATERNDRLVAVATENHTYSRLNDLSQLNPKLVEEISQFFVNYHELQGSKFKVLGVRGAKQAARLLKKAIRKNKAA